MTVAFAAPIAVDGMENREVHQRKANNDLDAKLQQMQKCIQMHQMQQMHHNLMIKCNKCKSATNASNAGPSLVETTLADRLQKRPCHKKTELGDF